MINCRSQFADKNGNLPDRRPAPSAEPEIKGPRRWRGPFNLLVTVPVRPGQFPCVLVSSRASSSVPVRPRQLLCVLVSGDDDHGAVCMMGDLAAHGAQHQAGEATHPPGADHQEVSVLGRPIRAAAGIPKMACTVTDGGTRPPS